MINDEIKLEEQQAKGTRIIFGETAARRRRFLTALTELALAEGFQEIFLPSIELEKIYLDKVGPELVERQMYRFKDKGGRDMCLRPEGTATCQLIARKYRFDKDVKLFYETRCWRYEQPQSGRYREFTQFGVEILNPSKDYREYLLLLAEKMVELIVPSSDYVVNDKAVRGLTYYVGDGFEIELPSLGAQKQIVGGGSYAEGIGFAIGVDRILLYQCG